jgi:hypothetical protein
MHSHSYTAHSEHISGQGIQSTGTHTAIHSPHSRTQPYIVHTQPKPYKTGAQQAYRAYIYSLWTVIHTYSGQNTIISPKTASEAHISPYKRFNT